MPSQKGTLLKQGQRIIIKPNKWYWSDSNFEFQCCGCGLIHGVKFSAQIRTEKKGVKAILEKIGFKMVRIK